MELKEFINQKIEMLKNKFSKDQIKKEVYEYCFKNYMPNTPLNTVIELCMDIYSEILKQYNETEFLVSFCKFYHKRFNLDNREQAIEFLINPFFKSV